MTPLRSAVAAAARGPVATSEAGGWSQPFCFAADFLGFSGHFPGYPVVPAVVQVLTAQLVVEAALGRPLQLSALENAKFLIQLRPEDLITVRCREKALSPTVARYEGSLTVAAGLAASFQLVFTVTEPGC